MAVLKERQHIIEQARQLVQSAIKNKKKNISFEASDRAATVIYETFTKHGYDVSLDGKFVHIKIPEKFFKVKENTSFKIMNNLAVSSLIVFILLVIYFISPIFTQDPLSQLAILVLGMFSSFFIIKKFFK